MGYFSFGAINFIYKIYRSKKFRKFLIGFGFLAFVLFTIFNNTTFAVEYDKGPDYSAVLVQQINFSNNMIDLFDGCIHTIESGNGTVVNNGGTAYTLESFNQLFKSYFANNSSFQNAWFYQDGSTNGLWCFGSPGSWTVQSMTTSNGYTATNEITTNINYVIDRVDWYNVSSNGWAFYIEVTANGYKCDFTVNTAHTFQIPVDVYDQYYSPSGANIRWQNAVGLIAHIQDYFMTGHLDDNIGVINTNEQINDTVSETNDFLNQDSDTGVVDDITNTLSDNTTDITQEGWNSIFTTLRNKFESPERTSLYFTIPFTDEQIYMTQATVFGGKYAELYNGTLGYIIRTCWQFVFGLYVFRDISKTINKVKSGNIEKIENSNIKEDLL